MSDKRAMAGYNRFTSKATRPGAVTISGLKASTG